MSDTVGEAGLPEPLEWWEISTDIEAGSRDIGADVDVVPPSADLELSALHRIPEEITAEWVASQLPPWEWRAAPNKTLNPYLIAKMAGDAGKGISKRAIMAKAGYSLSTWGRWVEKADQGVQPYALWYKCMIFAIARVEEELIQVIQDAGMTDWKAAKWLLEQVNRAEYRENAASTAITVHGGVTTDSNTSINFVSEDDAFRIAKIMQGIGVIPPADGETETTFVDAEVIEDSSVEREASNETGDPDT